MPTIGRKGHIRFDMILDEILESDRVHPDGKGSVNPLAGKIGAIAIDALIEKRIDRPSPQSDFVTRSKRRESIVFKKTIS